MQKEMEDKFITLKDETGEESLFEIIFTFISNDENYVILTPVTEYEELDEDEIDVIAYRYEENEEDGSVGELFEIETEEEWEVVEEMINTFSPEEMDQEDIDN